MADTDCIRKAHSCATDPREAAQEFHAMVAQPSMALVIFFCSSEYDLDALADELKRLFGEARVVGCTTAGEIGPAGFRDHSLTGASFPASHFRVAAGQVDHLQHFKEDAGQDFAQALLQKLLAGGAPTDADNSFALLLIDGLSLREEPVTRAFQAAKANPDGSLTFFCAIENGLVLRVAKGVDLLQNLEQAFAGIRAEMGPPQLVLGYDCILRKLEIMQSAAKERIGEVLQENNTIGFHTYGEQFRGVHVNQTLVGIAFGANAVETDDV